MKLWEALKAFDEGKEVEYRSRLSEERCPNIWTPLGKGYGVSHWQSETCEFRLKPQSPEVVEFVLDCRENSPAKALDQIDYAEWKAPIGRRWRIVATEIVEGEG